MCDAWIIGSGCIIWLLGLQCASPHVFCCWGQLPTVAAAANLNPVSCWSAAAAEVCCACCNICFEVRQQMTGVCNVVRLLTAVVLLSVTESFAVAQEHIFCQPCLQYEINVQANIQPVVVAVQQGSEYSRHVPGSPGPLGKDRWCLSECGPRMLPPIQKA